MRAQRSESSPRLASAWATAQMNPRLPRSKKIFWLSGITTLLTILALSTGGYRYQAELLPMARGEEPIPTDTDALQELLVDLQREKKRLDRQLRRTAPYSTYIVIDRTHNRLQLRHGDETVHEAVCSAGSGMVLRDEARDREWVFDTPQGRFQVLRKIEDPVWKKPDWAFIEEGRPLPSDPGERIEYGVLGEYALYFGDGYMLHGTLYERLLGRSVTHGCIRLGREDLRAVYHSSSVGTPIFIY